MLTMLKGNKYHFHAGEGLGMFPFKLKVRDEAGRESIIDSHADEDGKHCVEPEENLEVVAWTETRWNLGELDKNHPAVRNS